MIHDHVSGHLRSDQLSRGLHYAKRSVIRVRVPLGVVIGEVLTPVDVETGPNNIFFVNVSKDMGEHRATIARHGAPRPVTDVH